ncbi:MAG: TraR/DksA C4-type zinc finger protein [Rhodococcus sp. (in: high G+C Gram-positive bacteria)]
MNSDRARIDEARTVVAARLGSLRAQFQAIVDGSQWSTDDDEHDPEGSTIAFERATVLSLARDAEDELRELDEAAGRVVAGTYGRCERCGKPIADARLDALPAARRCIACVRVR